jgi:hypothetical protein
VERLWSPKGREALDHLRGRGLNDTTIGTALLGVTQSVMIPTRDGDRAFCARGITIPWFSGPLGERLVALKLRQPGDLKPKYVSAYCDHARVYPSPEVIRPGRPLIICEGEFDCLLLKQELGDLASVITFGSASSIGMHGFLPQMLASTPWYIATDSDPAGDKAAANWPNRAVRVRPPEGVKDWTELWQSGFNRVRYSWGAHLPMSPPWKAIGGNRWGPAVEDETTS